MVGFHALCKMTDDTDLLVDALSSPETPSTVHYKSYLLRLWREDIHSELWRATLQSVTEPTDRHSFPDMEGLVAYLLANTERNM